MRQFICVLKFELGNYFKNKSFMVVTILFAVLAAGAVAVPGILNSFEGKGKSETRQEGDTAAQNQKDVIAVYDVNNSIADVESLVNSLENYQIEYCDSEDQIKELVAAEQAEAGFIVQDMQNYIYVVENLSMTDELQEHFENALGILYRADYLSEKGMDVQELEELYHLPINAETEVLGKNSASNYAYTYMLIFVLYFLILFYGQMVASAVTTEKSNRAIEILVTSVNSNSLIFGKVLAGAISGVLQTGIILGSAIISYSVFRDAWDNGLDFLFQIPVSVWITFIVFGLMGYLFYTFIYGMLGALVSKTEDISKASSPILIIYVASFMIAMFSLTNSDSMLVKICSFIPFTSSNCMLIRIAMGSVEIWEILLSGGILAVSCIGAGILAAKIFRFGTLMYGNPIKFSNALKSIRHQ